MPGSTDTGKDLGSVPWLFSHLKLTMHVFLFETITMGGETLVKQMEGRVAGCERWTRDVEAESMGTGMRKCWALVQAAS